MLKNRVSLGVYLAAATLLASGMIVQAKENTPQKKDSKSQVMEAKKDSEAKKGSESKKDGYVQINKDGFLLVGPQPTQGTQSEGATDACGNLTPTNDMKKEKEALEYALALFNTLTKTLENGDNKSNQTVISNTKGLATTLFNANHLAQSWSNANSWATTLSNTKDKSRVLSNAKNLSRALSNAKDLSQALSKVLPKYDSIGFLSQAQALSLSEDLQALSGDWQALYEDLQTLSYLADSSASSDASDKSNKTKSFKTKAESFATKAESFATKAKSFETEATEILAKAQKSADALSDHDPKKSLSTAKTLADALSKYDPFILSESSISTNVMSLSYLHNAPDANKILEAIKAVDPLLKNLAISSNGDNELVLYGPRCLRRKARRVLALLDLPSPSIQMEMWGVEISSNNPESLKKAMEKVSNKIEESKELLRETYKDLESIFREEIKDEDLDEEFKRILIKDLGYSSALDPYRPLSLADMLLRLTALDLHHQDKAKDSTIKIAKVIKSLFEAKKYKKFSKRLAVAHKKRPFGNFFETRFMQSDDPSSDWNTPEKIDNPSPAPDWYFPKKMDNSPPNTYSEDAEGKFKNGVFFSQTAVLEFALHYSRTIDEPQEFDPYYLQVTADKLNSRLQLAMDAINLDIQELIVEPTLEEIEEEVRKVGDVDFARVGKTRVSGLSGVTSEVKSETVSVSDVNPPLRLSDLIAGTSELYDKTSKILPSTPSSAAGAVPAASIVSTLGALSENRTLWRELTAGTTLKITPYVLRNATSAELQIDLTTGPTPGTVGKGVRPLSRLGQNNVKTSVYVNTLDLFTLSTFSDQSTVDGGRTYVPLIGSIWEGLFSGVPVFGDLFSWKNPSKTIYHQSVVVVNTFLNPTAKGLALLYPIKLNKGNGKTFEMKCQALMKFKVSIESDSTSPLGCDQ